MLYELNKKEIRNIIEDIKTFVSENLDEWYIKQEILDNLTQLTIILEQNDVI